MTNPITEQIVRITLFSRLQGQDSINVFFYATEADTLIEATLQDIATTFRDRLSALLFQNLSNTINGQRLLVEEMTNQLSFVDLNINLVGALSGECLPAHDTISITQIRNSRITRNGRKSFSGVPESRTSNGTLQYDAGEVTELESLVGDAFQVTPSNGVDPVYVVRPVIVGRTKDANGVYQLDFNKINSVSGASLNTRVRTQNTRK